MTILIPAYEPNERLLTLIKKIKVACKYEIVVVDDGSGNSYEHIFKAVKAYGCKLLRHNINQGKGSALKTGFRYIMETQESEGVVCADSDGQHLPQDIIKIARKIIEGKSRVILGCRHFTGSVPLRSRFGNSVTRMIYSFSTGHPIRDTQTGLRGYSVDMLDWLCHVPGERFEYEINILLEADTTGYSLNEVEIDTVYLDNDSSHFRTIIDSARVYLPLLKFSTSSLLSTLLDFMLLLLLQYLTSNLLLSVVGARVCSSILNYTFNRVFVFSKAGKLKSENPLLKYFTLVFIILVLNYSLMDISTVLLGIPLFAAKLLTEGTLFSLSYWIQKKFVFTHQRLRESYP